MTKVFITKYALTSGIIEADVVVITESPKFCSYCLNGSFTNFFHGNDFHYTKEDAISDFEKRKQAKLLSLTKKIIKIEKLKPKIIR